MPLSQFYNTKKSIKNIRIYDNKGFKYYIRKIEIIIIIEILRVKTKKTKIIQRKAEQKKSQTRIKSNVKQSQTNNK